MAEINKLGNIISRCPGCDGGKSTFEYMANNVAAYGLIRRKTTVRDMLGRYDVDTEIHYRLFRCAGCGMGGIGSILMKHNNVSYPDGIDELLWFEREAKERLKLPANVPDGIRREFREAEMCLENQCYRAAAALFRSVLDKALKSSGYKVKKGTTLEQAIDSAAAEGVITESRKIKAHEDIRVLGNDVLHADWQEIKEHDVEPAHHYAQRILEDLYDDRDSVLKLIRKASRAPEEDKLKEDNG